MCAHNPYMGAITDQAFDIAEAVLGHAGGALFEAAAKAAQAEMDAHPRCPAAIIKLEIEELYLSGQL